MLFPAIRKMHFELGSAFLMLPSRMKSLSISDPLQWLDPAHLVSIYTSPSALESLSTSAKSTLFGAPERRCVFNAGFLNSACTLAPGVFIGVVLSIWPIDAFSALSEKSPAL